MENALQTFEFMPGMQIRAFRADGEVWFILSDIGHALEMNRTTWNRIVDTVTQRNIQYAKSQRSERKPSCRKLYELGKFFKCTVPTALVINEPMLYMFVMRSNKPEAVGFQQWIATEVLPALKETGRYEIQKLTAEAERTLTNKADVKSGRLVNKPFEFSFHTQSRQGEITLIIKGNSSTTQENIDAMRQLSASLYQIIATHVKY